MERKVSEGERRKGEDKAEQGSERNWRARQRENGEGKERRGREGKGRESEGRGVECWGAEGKKKEKNTSKKNSKETFLSL